jgi:hypothetical protein
MVSQLPLTPGRGRFLRPFHTGIFIRDYLLGKEPFGSSPVAPKRGAATEDIRYAYKTALLREYAEDMVAMAMEKGIELLVEEALERIPKRLTKMRSHSFYRYFHHLKMLGWVELTGEEERSAMGGIPGARVEKSDNSTLVEVPQPRRYYRLTAKGKTASSLYFFTKASSVFIFSKIESMPPPFMSNFVKSSGVRRIPSEANKSEGLNSLRYKPNMWGVFSLSLKYQ